MINEFNNTSTENNNNLFGFDYQRQQLFNRDSNETESRFSVVYGQDGKIIHTKKDSYTTIETQDVSALGKVFIEKGYNVKTYIHRAGEVIGLNIEIPGVKPSVIGDKSYSLIVNVNNSGGGIGTASVYENRLICTNGMMRKNIAGTIAIPHLSNYTMYLDQAQKLGDLLPSYIEMIEKEDAKLDSEKLTEDQYQKLLNTWFFMAEFPESQKSKDNWTLDSFRRSLALDPESVPCIKRYNQLMSSKQDELFYNKELGLDLSRYTLFATITNYLSNRLRASNSKAPDEIKFMRDVQKVNVLDTKVFQTV